MAQGNINRVQRRHRAYVILTVEAAADYAEKNGCSSEIMFWSGIREIIESAYPKVEDDLMNVNPKLMIKDLWRIE